MPEGGQTAGRGEEFRDRSDPGLATLLTTPAGAALDPAILVRDARDCERAMLARHPGYATVKAFFPPLVTSRTAEAAFGRCLEELLALFAGLPARLAAWDGAEALLARLRYTQTQRAMLLPYLGTAWSRLAASLARFDLVASQDGPRVLELNATGGIGGLGVLDDYAAAFEAGAVAAALRAAGVGFHLARPMEAFRAFVISLAAEQGIHEPGHGGEPLRVAITSLPREQGIANTAACVRTLASAEVETILVSPFDIETRPEGAFLGGQRIHVVWACIAFEAEATMPDLWAKSQTLLALAEAGALAYLVPPSANVLGNKALLALLTSERRDALFSAEERALIDRTVPWTALVTPDAVEALSRRQAELILKPARGVAGIGILYGQVTSEAGWRMALTKVAAAVDRQPFVVQELCRPQVLHMPAGAFGGDEAAETELVLGGLCIDGRYAANVVRGQPAGSFRPINAARGGRFGAVCVLDPGSVEKDKTRKEGLLF